MAESFPDDLPMIIRPLDIDGTAALVTAALVTAGATEMRKRRGERDTEFVKRIVSTYLNATHALGVKPVRD